MKLHMVVAMNDIMMAKKNEQKNTLFFFYYAGHGRMDMTTHCVLNGHRSFNIEEVLRDIAKCHGSYVVALLDCCRE